MIRNIAICLMIALSASFVSTSNGSQLLPEEQICAIGGGETPIVLNGGSASQQGLIKACNGAYAIQGDRIRLTAMEKTVFGIKEDSNRWDITLEFGRIEFVLNRGVKPVQFHTVYGAIEATEPSPAGSGQVRGFVNVSPSGAEIQLEEGALKLNGKKSAILNSGESLTLDSPLLQ